jgi:ATP-dependent DNA helicase RecQ
MRRAITPKRKKKVSRTPAGVRLSDADSALLEQLKEWRKQEALTQGVPAYVILHDSSLIEVATSRP